MDVSNRIDGDLLPPDLADAQTNVCTALPLRSATQPARAGEGPSVVEELAKLQVLRECGALTESEFDRAKGLVLEGRPAGQSAAQAFQDVRKQPNWLQRMARSDHDAKIWGVCAGLGEHTPVPAWCWRLLFCIAIFGYGVGVGLYFLLGICLPDPPPSPAAAQPPPANGTNSKEHFKTSPR